MSNRPLLRSRLVAALAKRTLLASSSASLRSSAVRSGARLNINGLVYHRRKALGRISSPEGTRSRGRANVRDRGGVSEAASGLVSVQVTLALPETHGIGLAFWQAEQAFFVVEVQERVRPVEHHEHVLGRYLRARERHVPVGPYLHERERRRLRGGQANGRGDAPHIDRQHAQTIARLGAHPPHVTDHEPCCGGEREEPDKVRQLGGVAHPDASPYPHHGERH